MKRLKDGKIRLYRWIGHVTLCFWQGVEAVSGKILFV